MPLFGVHFRTNIRNIKQAIETHSFENNDNLHKVVTLTVTLISSTIFSHDCNNLMTNIDLESDNKRKNVATVHPWAPWYLKWKRKRTCNLNWEKCCRGLLGWWTAQITESKPKELCFAPRRIEFLDSEEGKSTTDKKMERRRTPTDLISIDCHIVSELLLSPMCHSSSLCRGQRMVSSPEKKTAAAAPQGQWSPPMGLRD